MHILLRLARLIIVILLNLALVAALVVGGVVLYLEPHLPAINNLMDTPLQVPLRIYTRDGKLIGEYGEKRRIPVHFAQVPPLLVKAFLAAEDDRFFEHPGVDYQGLLRAAFKLARTGTKSQGGSTITMQVARNYFLSSEKTYLRKLNEILLALKIERELEKSQILELYLNKIYFGNRAYGVAAAAQIYYGRPMEQLTLAQMAMIAGLPKAPSRYNPISDPPRALARRNYVLGRMHDLRFINDAVYRSAYVQADDARLRVQPAEVEAPFVAEMVRAYMSEHYGAEQVYTSGYHVYTTLDSHLQHTANVALRQALIEYDWRHGYHGPEAHVDLPAGDEPAQWNSLLARYPAIGRIGAGVVIGVDATAAQVYRRDGQRVEIPWAGLRWARRYSDTSHRSSNPTRPSDVLARGDIVRVYADAEGHWQLTQIPRVEGALVSVAPADGAVIALVGGFDFYHSKFNRVVQALRLPGSAFKPFIYSAALEKGFTPASLLNDTPIEFNNNGKIWRPVNYDGKFLGPTRLRVALAHSRNVIAVRLLQAIGVKYAINYAERFGFDPARLPRNLSLALGTATVTPMEMAGAYTVFANGGYKVAPYFIDHIEAIDGSTILQAKPEVACSDCLDTPDPGDAQATAYPNTAAPAATPATQTTALGAKMAPRVISAPNWYLMNSMLRDVIQYGTGKNALALGRNDLAGKTGTTNEQRDAWFCGFTRNIVTVTWVGYDAHTPLGDKETGGHTALPMWMYYMRTALANTPELPLQQPAGIVTMRINPQTGAPTYSDDPQGMFEVFMADKLPSPPEAAPPEETGPVDNYEQPTTEDLPDQLF
ncbi:MAG: penicillin-binding protein 1A [Gammaproteobacteria bacterium]